MTREAWVRGEGEGYSMSSAMPTSGTGNNHLFPFQENDGLANVV